MDKEVIFSPNAEREIKKLTKQDRQNVWTGLKKWRSGELCPDVEKIKAAPNFYRVRFGNFRVIYYPLSKERIVLLLVRDRKEAYRSLGDLDGKLDTALTKLKLAKG